MLVSARLPVLTGALALSFALAVRAQCGQWSDQFATGGVDKSVLTLAARDFGQGPVLLFGGEFTVAGDRAAAQIASWDGASWSDLGGGLGGVYPCCPVERRLYCSLEFDDGSGPALYFGGQLFDYNGVGLGHLGRWDGASVTRPGDGFDLPVNALVLHDDGSGVALFAGGKFTSNGATSVRRIAKWEAGAWRALAFGGTNGLNGTALAGFDDGAGEALFIGGAFGVASGVAAAAIVKWDGVNFSALDAGLTVPGAQGTVEALAVFDDGQGPALYAGGGFRFAGSVPAQNVARWDGSAWSALGGGLGVPHGAAVSALAEADFGAGAQLHAGGSFTAIGGALAVSGSARPVAPRARAARPATGCR